MPLRISLFLLLPLLSASALCAPPQTSQSQAPADKIYLDVVVTRKSGPPISGLQQQDFTLLDNKAPQTISSFRALTATQAPIVRARLLALAHGLAGLPGVTGVSAALVGVVVNLVVTVGSAPTSLAHQDAKPG